MLSWPSTIPIPKIQMSLQKVPQQREIEFETGRRRVEKTTFSKYEYADVRFSLTQQQYSTFYYFYYALNFGQDWFQIELNTGYFLSFRQARFVGGIFETESIEKNHIEITAQFELTGTFFSVDTTLTTADTTLIRADRAF